MEILNCSDKGDFHMGFAKLFLFKFMLIYQTYRGINKLACILKLFFLCLACPFITVYSSITKKIPLCTYLSLDILVNSPQNISKHNPQKAGSILSKVFSFQTTEVLFYLLYS